MTVAELIQALQTMPQDAEVWSLWDGALRGRVDGIWLAKSGVVGVGSSRESPCYPEDRPDGAPEGWRPAPDEEDELTEAAVDLWKATAAKYLRGGK